MPALMGMMKNTSTTVIFLNSIELTLFHISFIAKVHMLLAVVFCHFAIVMHAVMRCYNCCDIAPASSTS